MVVAKVFERMMGYMESVVMLAGLSTLLCGWNGDWRDNRLARVRCLIGTAIFVLVSLKGLFFQASTWRLVLPQYATFETSQRSSGRFWRRLGRRRTSW